MSINMFCREGERGEGEEGREGIPRAYRSPIESCGISSGYNPREPPGVRALGLNGLILAERGKEEIMPSFRERYESHRCNG